MVILTSLVALPGKNSIQQPQTIVVKLTTLSMEEQKYLLDVTNVNWREGHEQVDDILVIGTRYI